MTNKEFKIINTGGSGEIIEKKSRFIATIIPVSTEEEATAFINSMKKKYWDARHNCSAFCIGDNNEITRCSDDSEPSGTAGRPMLDVLLNEGIHNVCVVVTRYFGGVLLGTGGLVRAYQGAVIEGLKNCELLIQKKGIPCSITTDYNGLGKIEYILRENHLTADNINYANNVEIKVIIPSELYDPITKSIIDKTSGAAIIKADDETYYSVKC